MPSVRNRANYSMHQDEELKCVKEEIVEPACKMVRHKRTLSLTGKLKTVYSMDLDTKTDPTCASSESITSCGGTVPLILHLGTR